jgi:hypothetical protein
MSRFDACGISMDVPTGWEVRATLPQPTNGAGIEEPYLHAASFALPSRRAPYGGGVVEVMGPSDMFVALVEFAPSSAGTALFASAGVPRRLRGADYSPATLQRALRGQSGIQRFFHVEGRAFSLFVVAGGTSAIQRGITDVNTLLSSVRVRAREVSS